MPVTQAEIAAIVNNDRDEAHDNALDAFHAIEALQNTATWMQLPIGIRRQLCASHAVLGAIADAIGGE